MSRFASVLAAILAPWLALAAPAAAQHGEFGAKATAVRERLIATHAEDPTASGTAIDVQDRVAVPRSLGDVVREAPGAQVRSTGGLGAFSSVSIRGADDHESFVLLDDIPLSTPDGGAFDLSSFPAELFERVDVFRGGAPVWLGSGAIGGVVRLVPRRGGAAAYDVAASLGSFGSWQAQAGASAGGAGALSLRTRAVVRSARNDYPYLDDRGTRFEPSDDRELRRKNAQLEDASGFIDLEASVLGGTLHALILTSARVAGEPGPGSQPTPNIHRNRLRGVAGVAYERRWSTRHRLQLVAATSYAHDRYADLFGELGVSRRWNTRDDAYRGFLRVADTLRFASWLEATLVGSYALDHYDWSDQFTFPRPVPSTRHGLTGAFELTLRGVLGGMPVELRPSARLEGSHTELHSDRARGGSFDASRAVIAPTFRVAAGISLAPRLSLTSSVATGVRLPSMFELFGDRGLVLPSPALKPVHSTTCDVGLTLRSGAGASRGSLELRAFIQERRDEIGSYRTAQYQLAHINLSEVGQRGVELGLRGALLELLSLHAAVTYMRTEDALGKRLPFRPVWNAFVRPELRSRTTSSAVSSAGASAELSHRSFVFADRANLAVTPACTTVALAASLGFLRDRLSLTGRFENVADARCSDWIGFPLPGRTLLFSLSYQETTNDEA